MAQKSIFSVPPRIGINCTLLNVHQCDFGLGVHLLGSLVAVIDSESAVGVRCTLEPFYEASMVPGNESSLGVVPCK